MTYPWSQAHFTYSCLFVRWSDWDVAYSGGGTRTKGGVVMLAAALLAVVAAAAAAVYPKLATGLGPGKLGG